MPDNDNDNGKDSYVGGEITGVGMPDAVDDAAAAAAVVVDAVVVDDVVVDDEVLKISFDALFYQDRDKSEAKKKGDILDVFAYFVNREIPSGDNETTYKKTLLSSALNALFARYKHLKQKEGQGTLSYSFFRNPLGGDTKRLLKNANILRNYPEKAGDLVDVLNHMINSLRYFMLGDTETWMYDAIWNLLSKLIGSEPDKMYHPCALHGHSVALSKEKQHNIFRMMVFRKYVQPTLNFSSREEFIKKLLPLFLKGTTKHNGGLLRFLVVNAKNNRIDEDKLCSGEKTMLWLHFGETGVGYDPESRSLFSGSQRWLAYLMVSKQQVMEENFTPLLEQLFDLYQMEPRPIELFKDRNNNLGVYINSLAARTTMVHRLKHYYACRLKDVLRNNDQVTPDQLLGELGELKELAKQAKIFNGALETHFETAISTTEDSRLKESSIELSVRSK